MKWHTQKLGEVCSFLNRGISPKYIEDGGICVLNQKCIKGHRVNYDLARRHNLSAKSVSAERYVQLGDVLVNSTGTGTLGRVAQVLEQPEEPTTVDSHVTIVRPDHDKFYPPFFGYLLQFIEGKIMEAGEGCGGQTELARSVLSERFVVSYPDSMEEQMRIVSVLDQAYANIDNVLASSQKNVLHSTEVFQNELQAVFSEKSKVWKSTSLGAIAEVQSGGTPLVSKKEFWGGDIPWYSSGELNDVYTEPSERSIAKLGLESSNAKLFPKGSLLIGMYDTAALKMSILDRDGAFNQAIAGVKPNEKIDLAFIRYAINAIKPAILNLRRGVRQKNLSLAKIKEISLGIPSVEEQRLVVSRLDKLSACTKMLENNYRKKIFMLNELKKSILYQAISGHLQ